MSWLDEKCERFMKLPKSIMFIHITAKFVFGLGLGALLAAYLQVYDWQLWGWLLIVLALILSIPGAYKVLKK